MFARLRIFELIRDECCLARACESNKQRHSLFLLPRHSGHPRAASPIPFFPSPRFTRLLYFLPWVSSLGGSKRYARLFCSQRLRFNALSVQRDPDDFEQVLTALAEDIQKRQTHLADIRLHERRITLMGTLYSFVAWAAYVGVWYLKPDMLPSVTGRGMESALEKGVKLVPVVLGPILCVLRFCLNIVLGLIPFG